MNTVDSLIQGLLAGALFAIVGGIIYAIRKTANKIINKKKIEIEKGLNYDFGQESLSVEVRMAIVKILGRIAENDGIVNSEALSVWLIIFQILGLDNLKTKTIETLEDEFNNYSDDEILSYLSDFNSVQKEWFLKATIFLMESEPQIKQKEDSYIQPILTKMGIRKKTQ